MASKGRDFLRGLAGLAGKVYGEEFGGQLLDVGERLSNVLEGAAAKAPKRKRAPSKRPPLELVAGGPAPAAEPPRQVSPGAVEGEALDVEFRPAAPSTSARPVAVTPRRRR